MLLLLAYMPSPCLRWLKQLCRVPARSAEIPRLICRSRRSMHPPLSTCLHRNRVTPPPANFSLLFFANVCFCGWFVCDLSRSGLSVDGLCAISSALACSCLFLLNRRARSVMSRLGVPIVDAAEIVEGEAWASMRTDGRHYHPIVPLEVGDRQ